MVVRSPAMTSRKKRTVFVQPDASQVENLGEVPTGIVIPLPPELATLLGGIMHFGQQAMALAQQGQALAAKAQALQGRRTTSRPRRR